MMRAKKSILFIIVLAGSMIGSSAFAALDWAKQSNKTKGATTITWYSSFIEDEYDCGQLVLQEGDLNIIVDAGDAAFVGFISKKNTFTPKKDVSGSYSTGTVFAVELDSMHYDKKRDVYIGNVHFKMRMDIDKDGQPGLEATADYGVNFHLERPGPWGNCN